MYALLIAVSFIGAHPSDGQVGKVSPENQTQNQRQYHPSMNQSYSIQDRAPWIYEPAHYQHHGSSNLDRYPTFRQRQYFRHYNYRNLMDYPWHEDLHPRTQGGHCGPTIYRLSTPLALPPGE